MEQNTPKKSFIPSTASKQHDLPISQHPDKLIIINSSNNLLGLRRRISSSWGALRRSQSGPAFVGGLAGGPLRRWWSWSLAWLLSTKPGFAKDLEMNEEEALVLGFKSKGSLRHIFFKMSSDMRRIARSEALPVTKS